MYVCVSVQIAGEQTWTDFNEICSHHILVIPPNNSFYFSFFYGKQQLNNAILTKTDLTILITFSNIYKIRVQEKS